MKRFLIRAIWFFLLAFTTVSGLILLSTFLVKEREEEILKLRSNIKTILAGDSSVEYSVNDTIVRNSINIAQSGEAYLYTYAKIKSLLNYNNNITTVLVGFSYHEILKDKESPLLFQDSYVVEKIKNYNYLLDKSDKGLIIRRNPGAYLTGLMQSVFNNLLNFAKSFRNNGSPNGRVIGFGGYSSSSRDKLKDDIRLQDSLINRQRNFQPLERGLLQEKYLNKISQLCRQKSVRLILLNTPKHKYYSYQVNQEMRNNWLNLRNSLSGDSLLDMSSFQLPDSCFSDITHLNYTGARIFSKYLDKEINPD